MWTGPWWCRTEIHVIIHSKYRRMTPSSISITQPHSLIVNYFFSGLHWPTVHTYPVKTVSENASSQKRSPGWRFLKRQAFGLSVDGRKRTLSNATMSSHHILLASRMLRKGSYPFVSACENDSNFFLKTEKKISVFKHIWIRVDGA